MSDFPKAAARISEGFCPLCDTRLIDAKCEDCDVGWSLQQGSGSPSSDDVQVFGTAGVLITPSRRLRPDEVRRMYARPTGPPP